MIKVDSESILSGNTKMIKLEKTSLLNSIQKSLELYVLGKNHDEVFRSFLETIVVSTGSEYGFLDEILCEDDGSRYKRSLTLSNISWDEDSSKLYENLQKDNLEFRNLNNLAVEAAKTGKVVISNHPSSDNRSGGLPPGHPPLNSFMGIPMFFGGKLVGVTGIANRQNGYTKDIGKFLNPFLDICASIIHAVQHQRKEEQILEELKENKEKYHSFFTAVPNGWSYHKAIVDNDGTPIDYIFLEVNDAFEKLTGLKKNDIIGKKVTEVLPGIESDPADWIGVFGKTALQGICASFENYAESIKKWYSVTSSCPQKGYFIAVFEDITERKKTELERDGLIHQLQQALAEVKTLRGIVPICSFCKKIRDDKGYWNQVEVYVKAHTHADFSHSFCPDCAKKHYPEFVDNDGNIKS